jgi:glycosidase
MCRLILLLLTVPFFSACGEDGLKKPPAIVVVDTVTVNDSSNIPPLEEIVMYEVNMRAFSQSGTLKGVQARLDNIQDMGVNVIWLMPIYPVGIKNGFNSPYSIRNYEAVSSEYGNLNDLIDLVNDGHSRDMAVILDWVANHTAWDHAWITEHPDWYAQDSNGNIISPPEFDWSDVAELNYNSNPMKLEMIKSMLYWVEAAGIDGFRCDAADYVPASFWKEALTTLKANTTKDLILLAEGGAAGNFSAGFEVDYSWNSYTALKNVFKSGNSAMSIISTHTSEFNKIPSGNQKLRYTTNHDIYAWDSTPIDDFSLQGSVAAFVISSHLGGVPLIYDGQEIGHPSNISFFGKDPLDWSINSDIYNAYHEIMAARSDLSAVHYGAMESYTTSDIVAFRRYTDDQEVLVVVNVRNQSKTLQLNDALKNTDWTNALTESTINLGEALDLGSYEYLILKK